MSKRLTAKQKKELAYEILELLKKYEMNVDVSIYFSGKCLTGGGEIIKGKLASKYFEYANDDTLSMSFEGVFYEVMNYYHPSLSDAVMPEFNAILEKYGLYYELGNAWNLATFYSESDLNKKVKESKEGKSKKNPLYIRAGSCPPELEAIRAEWAKRENEYGDVGSCVLGAGFTFKFKGRYYKMPPQGHFQGSCSWEASKDDIQSLLVEAGCEELQYHWGNMD